MSDLPAGAVAFARHHVPALESGDYALTMRQKTDLDGDEYALTRTFTVAGDRFGVAPAAVRATYPPDGGLGEYGSVLPHVVLDRPTLPWQRSPDAVESAHRVVAPWLAVLVFAEDELPPPRTVTLADLGTGVVLERHQRLTDPVTVLDVDADLLAAVLPTRDELALLAHVRSSGGTDTAVVVAGRLPPAGRSCVAHLVSLEGRFRDDASGTPRFDLGPADGAGHRRPVRLVSLTSWRFTDADPRHDFAGLAHDLARDGGSFRLPDCGQPDADRFLRQGFVPVRRRLRDGGQDVCWIRGPLVTGPVDDGPLPPARAADALLRFYPAVGMLDVGEAAAWQLGRLLALQSTDVAVAIRGWRRRRRHLEVRAAALDGEAYPLAVAEVDAGLPDPVLAWLQGLCLLRGVPFAHLVPDERLLPVETVRFFGVDQRWVRRLVDGACSIGRFSSADTEADAAAPPPLRFPTLTGALIRSALVSGYPDLVVEAFDDGAHLLPPARIEQVADGVLLCLFTGELARLDLRQHPAAQHFAVEQDDPGTVGKGLRPTEAAGVVPSPVGPFPVGPRGKVPVAALAEAIGRAVGATPLGAAELAAQLVEVAQRVSFTR